MKKHPVLLCALLLLAVSEMRGNDYRKWIIKLLDDSGEPIVGVEIKAATVVGWQSGTGFGTDVEERAYSLTRDGGIAEIYLPRGDGRARFSIAGNERIYAMRWESIASHSSEQAVEIYGKTVQAPVSMYRREFGEAAPYWVLRLPNRHEECGFDLEVGDWVAPFGRGATTDLTFRWKEIVPFVDYAHDFDVTLEISFPGSGNGILETSSREPGPCAMSLPRKAPLSGYLGALELKASNLRRIRSDDGAKKVDNRGYFFRARTVLDETGSILQSRYGKIVGPISFRPNLNGATIIKFAYYLNPTDGDTNMEHKLDKNLFTDADILGRRRR